MGKKLDALLRRNFKTAKFKTFANLAISRIAVLKNQRKVRCSQARSDTVQLLNLGDEERALLRVEIVIKEQNMLDVFVMMEGYCHVLIDRVALIENNKECPDELKEAISSLIFAASRCGDFPELQEIRAIFASRFGKEFVARSVELRNGCGVNPKVIQKLSTRQASSGSRMKILKEIASENGITLQLQEEASVTEKENLDFNQKQHQFQTNPLGDWNDTKNGDQTNNSIQEVDNIETNEQTSGSLRTRRYYDVASAAQAAFESAAYAAAAARAAVELSRSDSQEKYYKNQSSPAPKRKNGSDDDMLSKSRLENRVVGAAFGEDEHSINELGFDNVHSSERSSSESEGYELQQNHGTVHQENFKGRTSKEDLGRSLSASSFKSAGDAVKETKIFTNIIGQSKPLDTMTFDESDDDGGNEYGASHWFNGHVLGIDEKSSLTTNNFPKNRQDGSIADSEEEVDSKHLNIERRPISVRTKRVNRW